MKLKSTILAALALTSAISFSCKKEDNTTTSKSMNGTIEFSLPEFVHRGEKYTFPHSKITLEDGSWKDIGYCWSITKFEIRDTTKKIGDPTPASELKDWELTIPDKLCTFTLTGMAFANGYYSKALSRTSTVIDTSFNGNGSITKFRRELTDVEVEDPRDGKKYLATPAGDRLWLRQNLVWREKGQAYRGYKELSAIFGQFYTWNEAQTVCDIEGDGKWRLPSDSDWAALAKEAGAAGATAGSNFNDAAGGLMIDAFFNGDRLWEFWPEVKITDKVHFSAMPFGYATKSGKDYNFHNLYGYAFFWTSDSDGEKGVARYIFPKTDTVYRGIFDKNSILAPVRCVRDWNPKN